MRLLIIGDYTIELMDTDLVSVTKSIYDVENPEQRKSSFTKTITLPASRVNNQVFSAYFEVGMTIESNSQFNPYYNPTKKVKAQYYEDTICIIEGYAQLTNITYTDEIVNYDLVIYGEVANFFKAIEGKKLSDLDLSGLDHIYDKGNIRSSWTATSGYVYPQVNNGKSQDFIVPLGRTQLRDYWKVSDFELWFFVHTIWERIWFESGFNYYSDFLQTDAFKKLIYKGEGSGMVKSDADVNDSLISYDLSTTGLKGNGTIFTGSYLYANDSFIFDTPIQDNNAKYNTSNGELTTLTTSEYDINFLASPVIKNVSGSTILANTIEFTFFVYLIDDLGNFIISEKIVNKYTQNLANNASFQFGTGFLRQNVRLLNSRTYKWCFAFPFIGASYEVSIDFTRFDIYFNKNYDNGDVVSVNSLLSAEMNQKDFIMGLVNMFNFYIEPYYYNPLDSNSGGYLTYLVEPRDNYYTNDIIDLTKKLDRNKEFKIKPLAGAKEKFIKYTYDLDNDYYNNLYNQRTGRIFGDYTTDIDDIDNDFLSGTKEVKIPFSLMILASPSDPTYPRLRPLPTDLSNSDLQNRKNTKSKPKIMYYSGMIAYDHWYFASNELNLDTTNEDYYPFCANVLTNVASGTVISTTIIDPLHDLCFDTPQEVYWRDQFGQIVVSNTGLFNQYHRRGIIETNNKNSKMIECYMNLTSLDMLNLSLRPIYEINGYQYRLYEVVDYNGFDTTLCKFLKLQGVAGIARQTGTTRGGRGVGSWGGNPDVFTDVGNGDRFVNDKNLVSLKNVLIAGSGETHISPEDDNMIMLSYRLKEIDTNTTLSGSEGSPLYVIADTRGGSIDLLLPQNDINLGKIYIVQKSSGSNNLVIKDYNDSTFETITSATTHEYILTSTGITKIR
jgi:hypothetical protein